MFIYNPYEIRVSIANLLELKSQYTVKVLKREQLDVLHTFLNLVPHWVQLNIKIHIYTTTISC